MNNEINNNNVNNSGNPAGVNFVQGGTPTGTVPTSIPPQQPTSPMPGQPMVAETGMPTAAPVPPQPVAPQPVNPAHLNFVQSGAPTPSTPQPVTPPPAINQGSIAPTPMPGTAPMAQPVNPMMPTQPTMGSVPGPMMPGNVPPAGMSPTGMPATTTEEGEKQPLPIVMIIITILVVAGVAIFLSMYLTGKINFSGKKSNNTQTTITNNQKDDANLSDWMNYLLSKETTGIKISRYVDSDNTKVKDLSKENLKNLFTRMKDYNVVKYYSSSKTMSNDDLQITYTSNDAAYTFTLSGEYIEPGEDSNLLSLFNNGNISIEDDGQTSRDSEDYHYILKNFNSSIYDEYFNDSIEEENGEGE